MYLQNPPFRKVSSKAKKHTHIAFTNIHQLSQQQQAKSKLFEQQPIASNLTEDKLKRQKKQLDSQNHQKIQKKLKLSQKNNNQINQYADLIQVQRKNQMIPPVEINSQSALNNIQQENNLLQFQTIELLKQLLFHPNRWDKNHSLVNTQIINKWILSDETMKKIKSCLILYMILFKFQQINWCFKKTLFKQTSPPQKSIKIELKNIHQNNLQEQNIQNKNFQQNYKNYTQNKFQKYLTDYVQWLVWTNQTLFQTSDKDEQFWALALNNCQKLASQYIKQQNPREKQKKIFLALYLLNAQDSVFKSTFRIPIECRNIIFMKQQDLKILPQCHWLLGLNISLKYFYKNSFEKRVKQSLKQQNIKEKQIKEFYLEYYLLQSYFYKKNIKVPKEHKLSLSQNILKWILVQSEQVIKNDQKQQFKKEIEKQIHQISSSLLRKGVEQRDNFEENLLLALEMLQRDRYLSEKQKDELITSILFIKEKIATKLPFNNFQQIISKLQHKHQTEIPKLFQKLTLQYNNCHKHLLASNKQSLKNDLLSQLKHLIEINIKYHQRDITQRICRIFTDFTLISHWNKNNIVKRLLKLLQKYIQNVQKYIAQSIKPQNQNIKQKQERQKQLKEQLDQLKTLNQFLKVNLKIQPLSFESTQKIVNLINNSKKRQSRLGIQQNTINFISLAVLSQLFNKTDKYRQLLDQIKNLKAKNHDKANINQSQTLLDSISKLAQQTGISYFKQQVKLFNTR